MSVVKKVYSEKPGKKIDKREKEESSPEEIKQLFQNLTNISPVGIFRTDRDGKITFVNLKLCEFAGLSQEEAMGEDWVKSVHPEDKETLLQKWYADSREGTVSTAEFRFLKPDGNIVWVLGNAVPELTEGKIKGYIGTVTDITERKHFEEVLKDNEAHLIDVLRIGRLGPWEHDIVKDQFILNDSFYSLFQTTVDEQGGYVLSSTDFINRFVHPDDRDALLKSVEKSMTADASEFASLLEHRTLYKNGEIGYITIRILMIRNKNGKPVKSLGIAQDITERKRAEAELIRSKEKAEESDRLKTAFLHNISHEIRTPLNAITGFSALLSEPGLDEHSKSLFVDTIIQNSDLLLSIINDILEISNIDAGTVKITKSEVEINTVLKNLFNQFKQKADEKTIDLKFSLSLSDSEAKIITDKIKLIQIISNLLNNAFKFTRKGQIDFGYELITDHLQFYVSDTGIGIPEDKLDRVFDRFYQIDYDLERKFEGAGLGLSICKAYVSLLGGNIRISSVPEVGTTIYFTVPFEKPAEQIPEPKPEVKANKFAFSEKKTILVVEDVDSNFNLIAYFLKKSNAEIIRANNGIEAVNIALSGKKSDLILMDIRMPEMDGYEAIRQIREHGIKIPVIAQTAYAYDKRKIIESGFTDIISKPFSKTGLLTILFEYLK